MSLGNPLASLAEEKHRISALAARPEFLLTVLFGFCAGFPEVVEVISRFHGWIYRYLERIMNQSSFQRATSDDDWSTACLYVLCIFYVGATGCILYLD